MCGVAGGWNVSEGTVDAMLDRLAHRGPDGRGLIRHGDVTHGHVRLALVDLTDASAQPFRRGSGVLSFNGEIWNYLTLRAELEAEGETFQTSGDTEVLAALLGRYGLAGLPRLSGQFAFVWSDGDDCWLVRDPFGEVPLYYVKGAESLLWSSERKAFGHGSIPLPVPPGGLVAAATGCVAQWYTAPATGPDLPESRLLELLARGVAERLWADAPVCCLVSGGLDSSLVLALAAAVRPDVVAYTAFVDPASEDLAAARRICAEFGVPLTEVQVVPDEAGLAEAIWAIEIASQAQVEIAAMCIPLARQIAADGFKACLSGEAADELFGGYGNFCIAASREDDAGVVRLRRAALAKMARGNFIRCNKAFMAAGVECRLPYMDRDLVEAAVVQGKAVSPPGKGLLKRAAASILPRWAITRTKQTFQGGSGMSDAAAQIAFNRKRYYAAEARRLFGYVATT